jgi:hypothetical protein
VDAGQARDDPGGRRATPFLVHFIRSVNPQLEKIGVRINQSGDPFPCGHASFPMLRFDIPLAAAFAQIILFILDLEHQVRHMARILLKNLRTGIDVGRQWCRRQWSDLSAARASFRWR